VIETVPGPAGPAERSKAQGPAVAALGPVSVTVPAREILLTISPSPEVSGLLTRAQGLIDSLDISSARLILRKALSMGSAQAAFRLAETYDPRMLSEWQVIGISGDAARAKELYARAAKAGVPTANERLSALK
jgi:TPR repeat protein